ncbi:MAG: dimethylsulfonioproprionate lyase family protein [Trueperaceae bacterium]|nr:dimethylsulfonioproprionate lyase family protein [Trueperaceae bacterium]
MSEKIWTHTDRVPWGSSPTYPRELQQLVRWQILVGGDINIGSIPHDEVKMGVLHIAPYTDYPAHSHPAPEIYYVLSGNATWKLDGDPFEVTPGATIYHAPHVPHEMIAGDDTVVLLWVWWAPGGDVEAVKENPELVE